MMRLHFLEVHSWPNLYFLKRKKSTSWFKVSKNRFVLLPGTNAVGDTKLRRLLVYQSEHPRACKGYANFNLPLIWPWNTARMTKSFFTEWCCPFVERSGEDMISSEEHCYFLQTSLISLLSANFLWLH